MNPPPVTASQAHAVYLLLHVTTSMIRMDRLYDVLYFVSIFLHIAVRFGFLATGWSSSLRDLCSDISRRMLALRIVERMMQYVGRPIKIAAQRIASQAGVRLDVINEWPVATWLRGLIARWDPQLVRTASVYYLLYTAIFTILWLPLSIYSGYVIPHRYGLSHQAAASWFLDFAKDAAVDALGGALPAAAALWLIHIFPRRWPRIFALWSAPLILIGIFLDPLFDRIDNTFTPLAKTSALYQSLHSLAARAGVPNATIYVVDKSKQTDETNAYVTGLGSSAQIVIWDTTIRRMKPDEVVAIVGHELGHYVEHHVVIGGLLGALAMFLYFPLLKWLADIVLTKFGKRWHIKSLSDPAAMPVFFLIIGILSFLISPAENAISRVIEHRADSYGLAITQNRLSMARAMVDLSNQNLDNPYPTKWEVFWLDDHPPGGERIRYALYGKPLQKTVGR